MSAWRRGVILGAVIAGVLHVGWIVHSQSVVPLAYTARTDRNVALEPALPKIARGQVITDATFGNRILRVTDGTIAGKPNREWYAAGQGSAEAMDFNADGSRFLVDGPGGETLVFDFNQAAFSASYLVTLPVSIPVWDPTNKDLLYGSKDTSMYSYNVATKVLTEVWNMKALADSLRSTSIGDNRRLVGFVGYQNTAPLAAAKDLNTGTTHILNTQAGTLDGAKMAGFASFTIHNIRLGQDGRYAILTPGDGGGAGDLAVWDIDGGTVTWCANASCQGHKANAYGWLLNNDLLPNNGAYFGPELLKRAISGGIGKATELVSRPAAAFTGTDSHYSWGNAQPNVLAPVIASSSGEPLGTGPVTGAWDREITAIATDGSNTVWRLAHTRSLFSRFEDGPHATVSRDGRYVLFGSNWGQSLGKNESGQNRVDVFVLELKTGAVLPPPPPPPPTPTAVNCTLAWPADWIADAGSNPPTESQTEQIVTPASNGGTCGPSKRTRPVVVVAKDCVLDTKWTFSQSADGTSITITRGILTPASGGGICIGPISHTFIVGK